MAKKQSFSSFHKTHPLTPNDMSFVQTLVGNGYSLEYALHLIGKSALTKRVVDNEIIEKPVAPKGAKSKDLDSKSKSRKSTSKVASNKSDKKQPALKLGDYVKVMNLKTNEIVTLGKITKVGKDSFYLNNAKKKSYLCKNCVKITKKDFGNLKKQLAKSKDKKSAVAKSKPQSVVLPLYYKVLALGFIIDKIDKTHELVKQVQSTAQNDEKKLRDILEYIKSLKLVKFTPTDKLAEVLKENNIEVHEVKEPMLNA